MKVFKNDEITAIFREEKKRKRTKNMKKKSKQEFNSLQKKKTKPY